MIMRVRQLAVNSAVRNAHFISTMQACDKEEVSQSTASLPLSGVSLLCENPAHFDIGVTFGRLSTWLYNSTSVYVTHAPHRLQEGYFLEQRLLTPAVAWSMPFMRASNFDNVSDVGCSLAHSTVAIDGCRRCRPTGLR